MFILQISPPFLLLSSSSLFLISEFGKFLKILTGQEAPFSPPSLLRPFLSFGPAHLPSSTFWRHQVRTTSPPSDGKSSDGCTAVRASSPPINLS